ncbi:MAG: BON domain-containing protein [Bryobacteraceae bacterium]
MWNDTDLQHDVEKELSWEPSVDPNHIGVTVKGGSVELSGQVDSYWEKCAAERAAWRVNHVKNVVNGLLVDLPFSALRADDDIALAAMSNLEWNCLAPEAVEIQVADGWVTLQGKVEWQYQKEEAERALCPLKGIRGIRNEITVEPTLSLGDVRHSTDEALKRNALVDASHIKTHVNHGVVSLRGTARWRAERDEAMHAAWSAPGVSKVEDHITIGLARGDG